MMGRQWWLALLLAVCAGSAIAGDREAVRQQVEASMLVTGTIDIAADGKVAAHTLDRETELPAGITKFIHAAVSNWRFEPIELEGNATRARAKMTLRIVSHELDDDRFSVRIAAASFVQDQPPASTVQGKEMDPPRYPSRAVRRGITGIVYTVVKVGRDGRVQDAVVERVNLRVVDKSSRMPEWRGLLADAVLRTARKWTFIPPSQGQDVDEPFWLVRVPVDFSFHGDREPDYGEWQAYVPGPRRNIPWAEDEWSHGSDALVAGGVYPLKSGVRLLTPLGPST